MISDGAALLPDVGVLALPYHHFGAHWMTPHHVLTRLSSYFEVLWLEPAHYLTETLSSRARRAEIEAVQSSLPSSFRVYVPEPWLPQVDRFGWLGRTLLRARVRSGWRQLRRRGCRTLVLHLWHPEFESALAVGGRALSLYHLDDDYSFLPEPPPMDAQERRVLSGVDQVFATSPGLMERKGGINPRMHFVPEGVDYRLYSTAVPEPPDIAKIPHPRIGYSGFLKPQLDWALLLELARRHRDWSFVFVGPRKANGASASEIDELSRLGNVHLLGPKSVGGLAAYPQHFDVCIMPYVVNGYTYNIYPLKLHEYLATGRPVVGSPIRSLQDFGHAIALASTADEWSAALVAGLVPPVSSSAAAAVRREIARQHDWSELVYRIARSIAEGLGPEYAARVRKVEVTGSL